MAGRRLCHGRNEMLYAHAIQPAKMHTSGLLSLVSTYGTALLIVRFTGNNSFRSTKSICLAPVSGIYSSHKAQAVLQYSLNPHIADRLIDSLPVPIAARLSPLHVLQKSMTSGGIAYYCALPIDVPQRLARHHCRLPPLSSRRTVAPLGVRLNENTLRHSLPLPVLARLCNPHLLRLCDPLDYFMSSNNFPDMPLTGHRRS
jgi:hypothetical protein